MAEALGVHVQTAHVYPENAMEPVNSLFTFPLANSLFPTGYDSLERGLKPPSVETRERFTEQARGSGRGGGNRALIFLISASGYGPLWNYACYMIL